VAPPAAGVKPITSPTPESRCSAIGSPARESIHHGPQHCDSTEEAGSTSAADPLLPEVRSLPLLTREESIYDWFAGYSGSPRPAL
jgi:hypothetical protein